MECFVQYHPITVTRSSLFFLFQTVQKDAWAELDLVEKRIRQQETDIERMKDEYHREVLHLRNLLKQKEIIIGRLQQEKTYVNNFIMLYMLLDFMSKLYVPKHSIEGNIHWLHFTRLKLCTCCKLLRNYYSESHRTIIKVFNNG
jgi:hypothetical protein